MHKMCDIHMHLVPGVDDGAMDMSMAMSMLLRAYDQGIRAIFATPHSSAFDDAAQETGKQFRRLQSQAGRFLPDVEIYPGGEVYCEAAGMGRVLSALESGKYPTMNGTDFVLMEFSMWVRPDPAAACVEAMAAAGWKPIVAHMERYTYLRSRMDVADAFRSLGGRIQVNAYSLFDETEDSIRDWARQLVAERKVDFLGTDAHRTYHRPPSAKMGLNWLYENHDEDYIDAIAWGNARRLLIDKEGII